MSLRPRIVLVEDDAFVREGLSAALSSSGYDVVAAADGRELPSLLDPVPDAVLLDIGLGEGPDGFELAATVRQALGIPVVFVTAADELDERLRGFEVGADDYLVKPFHVDELLARLAAVLRRAGRTGESASVGDVTVDLERRTAKRGTHTLDLTPIEFDLLVALVLARGRAVAKRALLRTIWGYDDPNTHVVEVHISALRRKLERHGRRVVITERDGYSLVR